jgi:hypothetical protein
LYRAVPSFETGGSTPSAGFPHATVGVGDQRVVVIDPGDVDRQPGRSITPHTSARTALLHQARWSVAHRIVIQQRQCSFFNS